MRLDDLLLFPEVVIITKLNPADFDRSMSELIQLEIRQQVALLTLNRPEKRNALTREVILEMNQLVEQVKADEDVRLLVLQATGSVFCAGMDLAEMKSRAEAEDPEQEWQSDSEVYNQLVGNLFSLSIPTLAVLPGPVLAGGTGLVFACDLVLASENAFISLPEPKRGIVAAMVTPLLMYRTNLSTASYLLLSGKNLSAIAAQNQGLFHEVVPAAELETAKLELINSILTGAQSALRSTKNHMRGIAGVDVVRQIQQATKVSAEARQSLESQEGLAAFADKRSPDWQIEFE